MSSKTKDNECLERDLTWISVFAEPYRDAEMLSWDNLKWNPNTKEIEPIE